MPIPPESSAPQRRDPALDGLRGCAILLVFLFHYGGGLRAHNPLLRALGYLTQAGWIGVDLFFALSGFLITGILADTLLVASPRAANAAAGTIPGDPDASRAASKQAGSTALCNFYTRRALRILPLYFVALLACAAAALLTGSRLHQLQPLLTYVAFAQNLPPLVNTALHTPPPLPVFHLWSLAVEEQFYLLWPLALLAARTPRRAFHLSLATFAASCLFRAVVFAPHLLSWAVANSFATFLPTRAGALALGSALALYRRLPSISTPVESFSRPERHTGSGPIPGFAAAEPRDASPAFVGLTAALSFFVILLVAFRTHTLLLDSRPAFLVTLPAADLVSATLVALALQPNLFRAALGAPVLAFLGRISYGFYVLHILLEPLFDRLGTLFTHTHTGFAYQAARLVVAFPLTTAAAWLSFEFLECPFLRLKRRFPQHPDHAL